MYLGGCLCGKIRFQADADADWPHLCSCPHCQKLAGGPVAAWVGFPASKFEWTSGEPRWYNTFPTTQRGFCPDCGSLLAARDSVGEFKDQMGVTMMALDDHAGLVPVHQSCKENAVSWLAVIDTVTPQTT
ncbi:GFA family protein [Nocardia sp. SYP-A9097]|uniref:GFA family protein n=1 Tax=Nocardia sp. SYP-A9097 TaxID=2663237 RepID=UPI00129BE460|nr:GFA family protein [Nocardia sp. SYP-A9097]MRH92415.1 GFA family protein [Nocardia sp. SYP-A9097]